MSLIGFNPVRLVFFHAQPRPACLGAGLEKEVTRAAEASVAVQAVLEAEIQEHNVLQSAARTPYEALEVGGSSQAAPLGVA